MAKVKCSLCSKEMNYSGRAAWPLCRECDSALPTGQQQYTPEDNDPQTGGMMGTGGDNPILHTNSYGGDLQQVAGPIWRVKSESAEKWYTVDLDIPKCDCTSWATSRNKLVSAARAAGKSDASVKFECKHCRAAKEMAQTLGATSDRDEKRKLREQTDRIKAQFTATKTKKDAMKMLRELDDL